MDYGSGMTTIHIIGRYKIIRELRRGGMATVYRAYDPRFEREVAIKVLPRELLFDSQFRARFETEAKSLAALEHPAIVPVYDYGEQDGQPYLVMRYMPGGSLEDRLKMGNLPLVEAARILSRLAPALDEAHARGMVHRDLKPANILFDQRSEPYITDFGVVKITGVRMTDTGNRSIGTPAYMSPEQARGEPDIDGRSDIFALGAVLYEMLTGKIPYDAETPAGQLVRRITDPVPNILELRPDLPPGVQEIIARALAKRRYVRFPTASDMARALDAVAQGKTPKDTLILDGTHTPASGVNSADRRLGAVRPFLKPASRTGRPLFSPAQRLVLVGLAAVFMAVVLYFGYQAYSVMGLGIGGQQEIVTQSALSTQPVVVPVTSENSPTPFIPVLGEVIEVSGVAQAQLPGQDPQTLAVNDSLPHLPDLHLWTSSGNLKIRLSDGAVIWLGEETSLVLPGVDEDLTPAAGGEAVSLLAMQYGSLLAKAPALRVITDQLETQPEFQAYIQYSTMGVSYDPSLGRFLVDCLEGSCVVGADNPQVLQGGQRGGYDRAEPLAVAPAEYPAWLALGGLDVPTPTITPTQTFTPEPTATDTPKPTATQEAPPVIQPTQPITFPQPQPTSPPPATSAPRPTSPPAPKPTSPPAPTSTPADPNQG
jgi:hypothetical protein